MSRRSRLVTLSLVWMLAALDARASDEPEGPEAATPALPLSAVLESTLRHHPLLEAALLEREARANAEMAARGAFDLNLQAEGDLRPLGFYQNYTGGAALRQLTPLWGSRLIAGYRYGGGDFPSYDGGRLTDGAGEVRVGVEIPLLRGGPIDPQRAALRDARILSESVEPEVDLERIRLARAATVAYWSWVAAGQRVGVAERLLEVAETRRSQLEGRVERGIDPAIDLVDNQRMIVERQAVLRGAQRDLRRDALQLSIFLRDAAGNPIVPEDEQVPAAFPEETPLEPAVIERDVDAARESHPVLRQLGFERERLELDVKLARNRVLPRVDVAVEGSRDFGSAEPGIDTRGFLSSAPRGDTELKALVRVGIPVQMREARGRLGVAEIRLAQLDRRRQLALDQLLADVRVAVEQLDTAFDQTGQARENAALAQRLRSAEVRKLSAGLSNLIDVNIREVQAATAERALVDAQAAYFRALAEYRASVAREVGT